MECRTNEAGYLALKRLNESRNLLFELKDLVNDLLKVYFPSVIVIQISYVLSSSSSRLAQSRT
jgi:hypothetical protein